MEEKPRIIVIAGPTASGKTSLAIELALAIGGEIVNADSMQVYRGMDVGTAKPDSNERNLVPHHLMDVVDPDEDFNAALYRSLALPVIGEILSRGKVPFVVGGTGLYIRVLLGGVVPSPPMDPELRRGLLDEISRKGSAALHQQLDELDPESAQRIHPHDRVRIVRAMEIIHLSKRPLSALVEEHRFRDNPFHALKICLQIEREQLYHRIDERCVRMIESGLAAETASLLKKGYSPALRSMTGLGYRHMVGVLEGRWDMDTALRNLQLDTRRYAKRQMTWFRADPENIWVSPGDVEGLSKRIREFLGEADKP